MTTYAVPVTDQSSGAQQLRTVEADCPGAAQVQALSQAFRDDGWRSAVAGIPTETGPCARHYPHTEQPGATIRLRSGETVCWRCWLERAPEDRPIAGVGA